MTAQTLSYLSALKEVTWQAIEQFESSEQISLDWLLENGSLSRRLSRHCEALTVRLMNNHMVANKSLTDSEQSRVTGSHYLVREVLLCGDQQPWLVARTLVPDHSLDNLACDLTQLGEIPLGLTVFQAEDVQRDALEFGWVETAEGRLIARRSRLWMDQRPMLVAELFLPGCPLYSSSERSKGVL